MGGGSCCLQQQQSSCGCGGYGRKKREIVEPIIFSDKDLKCPQEKWKNIIIENLTENIEESEKQIQKAFYKQYYEKVFVTCNSKTFTTNGHAFCGAGNKTMFCYLIALLE
uniref:Ground-like domain-containing protein n=1 Tax=Parastrongyloides trichosuri TaxID=131310 RepID=A0A0N4ZNM9_PARTI